MRKICKNGWWLCVAAGIVLLSAPGSVRADSTGAGSESRRPALKRTPLDMFPNDYVANVYRGKVEQLPNDEVAREDATEKPQAPKSEFDAKAEPGKPVAVEGPGKPAQELNTKNGLGKFFVDNNPKPEDILSPELDPQNRVNPDAPSAFIGLHIAWSNGDRELAARYAEQLVRYQSNLFFEVRELTSLIGQALVRYNKIDADDWQGVPQYLDYEFANARQANNDVFRPTHDDAMGRIKPDPKNEAAVYYFFGVTNCRYCREMTPDVERLYQVLRNDSRVKMVALNLDQVPKDWMQEYRNYTGLTMPVFDGTAAAKAFGVKYAPALVVVPPHGGRAYLKTGQQSFQRMYEFVRTVQGVQFDLSQPEVQAYAGLKVGQVEKASFNPGKSLSVWLSKDEMATLNRRPQSAKGQAAAAKKPEKVIPQKVELGRF